MEMAGEEVKKWLVCHTCGFKTRSASDMADHMLMTKHGLTDKYMKILLESDALSTLVAVLEQVQAMK